MYMMTQERNSYITLFGTLSTGRFIKIPQHKNGNLFMQHVAEEYFYIKFSLFIQHIFLDRSA